MFCSCFTSSFTWKMIVSITFLDKFNLTAALIAAKVVDLPFQMMSRTKLEHSIHFALISFNVLND